MVLHEKAYLVNNVQLQVREAGPPEGNILLFLHGFPEFWYGWEKQLSYFASNGFRVVAPDQRGYNQSSKPAGVSAYKLEELSADIAALIRELGPGKVTLIGHDWGGAVAWAVAYQYPELLKNLVILNMPHPEVLKEFLRENPKQMLKSCYAAFFQFPWLPEAICRAFNFRILARSLTSSARRNTFSPEDLIRYKTAWKQPGALKTMLNWYRANLVSKLTYPGTLEVPTLLLWGKKDAFLSEEMALPSIERCTNGQLIFLKDNTHWLHHENPEQVNRFILNFLNSF